MEAIRSRNGCPARMRGDQGTENAHVTAMQGFLTEEESFFFGKSTANQRIEMFCSFLRRQCSQFGINVLSNLRENGEFTGDFIDVNLVQFCFMKLLQLIHY